MTTDVPLISIVVVAGSRRERTARALCSILTQTGLERAEVILIDAGAADLPPIEGGDHPAVRYVRRPERPLFGLMRAEAVQLARGRYVAFLEEHCVALPGWLDGIVQALEGGWVGVGGEGHTANPGAGISDAIAMMNYLTYRPPARRGSSRLLPGQNSAYHRERLLAFGGDLPALLQSEALLQWRLAEQGHQIGLNPAVKFAHLHEIEARSAGRGLYWYCRCFGHNNARLYGWSALMRLFRALLTPLMPVVRFLRYVRTAIRERPDDRALILRHWPTILYLDGCSAAGMAAGYLWGAGEAERRFTDYELDEPRE